MGRFPNTNIYSRVSIKKRFPVLRAIDVTLTKRTLPEREIGVQTRKLLVSGRPSMLMTFEKHISP